MAELLLERLVERATPFADRAALVDAGRSYSYAELFQRAEKIGAAFSRLGVHKGDAILAFLPNVHEAVECELAALSRGYAWITLTSRLTWAEVRGVVASCRPKIIVTDVAGRARIEAGLAALPLGDFPPLVVTGEAGERQAPALSYEALLGASTEDTLREPVGLEDVARLRYTSGTTGSAKAAVLPQRVYAASLDALLHELGPFTGADRALHAAPLTHGSGALLYPVLFAGGTNYLVRHFDVDDVLSLIERERITTMFTVPTMLSRLVTSPSFGRYDLSSLRALVYGGAPMPVGQLDVAIDKLGHALFQIYGMTEAPWPIALLGPRDHVRRSARLTSVGRPAKGVQVRIADPTPEGVGEIRLRGNNVMSGYLDDAEGTRAVLHDGELSTGDLGRFDEDGYLFIVGRAKDVVISGGFNVYAAEVEAVLSAHDAVLEVAVVGLPHDDWGELVAAFVVPKPGATLVAADLDALARERLSGYKCPRRIEIVADLPKNASGKLQKSEIVLRARGDLR
ncbi:MAG TPA: AMP-binding protein [Polyangiaceae bacterium]|jgi:acyl-CoA synthetase (AMP-forming)/AMP-acid ligase II|nr:AMP-binding protein [Polyangiaceae bacterium]